MKIKQQIMNKTYVRINFYDSYEKNGHLRFTGTTRKGFAATSTNICTIVVKYTVESE